MVINNEFSKVFLSIYSKEEIKLLKSLNNPYKLQEFIDKLSYNTGKRICPAKILQEKRANCFEAALFCCAVLSYHGYETFLIDMESVRDEDHVLCVYKKGNRYGSIAQSKFLWLKGRTPIYFSVRELVMSYFEHFFNFFGELTLRRYSVPIRLKGQAYVFDKKEISKIEANIFKTKHFTIIDEKKRLPLVSNEKFEREIVYLPKNARVGKKYQKTLKIPKP
jgi:hypothetical protein